MIGEGGSLKGRWCLFEAVARLLVCMGCLCRYTCVSVAEHAFQADQT